MTVKLKSIVWFLRPTVGVIVVFGIVWLVANLAGWDDDTKAIVGPRIEAATDTQLDGIALPSTSLAPHDVVQIQLSALADDDQSRGIYQCLCFASPKNRAMLGSMDQFIRAIRSPPFDVLADPDSSLVGKPAVQGKDARVLVTIVHGKEMVTFVWLLSRQTDAPYTDCWMTDGVYLAADRGEPRVSPRYSPQTL